MFFQIDRKLIVLFVALGLTGCQSTGQLDLTSQASIQAAGFERLTTSPPSFGAFPAAAVAFGCPPQRCGALAVIAVVNMSNPNPTAGLTTEQAVRANIYNAAAVKPLMEKVLAGNFSERAPGVATRLSRYSLDPKTASQRFTMQFTDSSGKTVFMHAYGRFVGNDIRLLMSMSERTGTAARYARPQWLN